MSCAAGHEDGEAVLPRRVIAHLDVDAFYASVELLKRPDLEGCPVVVAGSGPRAVVTTASYEARRFGIDSAMPAARARQLCPHAVFLAPDFDAYRSMSRDVWDIVRTRVEVVEQVGIDEAYLDISTVAKPLRVLRDLVFEVKERTGMTVSVGVGPSRLVAKTASSSFKPAAFAALGREDACRRFASAPTRILQGVGPKTAERLAQLGIHTVGDLQSYSDAALEQRFGDRWGRHLKARAFFFDDTPVETVRVAKSRSNETTFPEDVDDPQLLASTLARLSEELCDGLRRRHKRGRTIAIKVRLDDWTTVTRARTIGEFTNDPAMVRSLALELLREYDPQRPVRLLGVRVASFEDAVAPLVALDTGQLALPV
jgi:DNA polymerase-4